MNVEIYLDIIGTYCSILQATLSKWPAYCVLWLTLESYPHWDGN